MNTIDAETSDTKAEAALLSEKLSEDVTISYQVWGQKLGSAPVVLVIHALTGNSDVASSGKGWWKGLIGHHKRIDLSKYSVLAINIPGNGYDGRVLEHHRKYDARDIACIIKQLLDVLGINGLYAVVGGSLGGGIAWELCVSFPDIAEVLVAVATDWKSTDWVMGLTGTQEAILLNSSQSIEDARRMAMFFYRTPASFTQKFERRVHRDGTQEVHSWLNHHGNKLANRFEYKAYLAMNHLLGSIDITKDRGDIRSVIRSLKCKVVQIAIDSDLLFPLDENSKTKELLDEASVENELHIIQSQDGHDAFLIENEQIDNFLKDTF